MIDQLFARHSKIALECSGGKDSIALILLFRNYLSKLVVYWCNPGDPDPDTVETMDWVRSIAPNFVEIQTNVKDFRKQFGAASPIVPMDSPTLPIISDHICCMHNIMLPMQNRVLADGNTCVIRGQKNADEDKGQLRSGAVIDGVEYLYPLEAWSDSNVLEYLRQKGVRTPKVYGYSKHGIDCLHCTGWWKHEHLPYLKQEYPVVHQHVRIARNLIKQQILGVMTHADI